MNVNIKISITDPERNLIARKLDGKNIKRMISRKEVNELVAGFMEGLLSDLENESIERAGYDVPSARSLPPPDLSNVPDEYADKPDSWKIGYLRGWEKVGSKRIY